MGSFTRLRGTSYLYNPSTGMFSQVQDLPSWVDDSVASAGITSLSDIGGLDFGLQTGDQAFADALARDYEEQLASQEVEDIFTNQLSYQPPDDFVGPVQPFVGPPEPEDDTDDDGLEGIADLGIEPQFEDPNEVFKEKAGEDLDLEEVIDLAFDVFGAYNRDAISNVVDIVNQRGISVGEVAQATGNSVESINQAAAESGTAIENQGTGPVTVDEGPAIGPQPSVTVDEGPAIGPTPTPTPTPTQTGDTGGPGDDRVTPETPIQILQTPETPKPTRQGLLAFVNDTSLTEDMFPREIFETKLRQLENVLPAATQTAQIAQMFAPRGMLRGLV
jgi:hypothetical protein